MRHRLVAHVHGITLERVTGRVAEIQRTADAVLVEILADNALFNGDALVQESEQTLRIITFGGYVIIEQAVERPAIVDQSVLEHLCVARQEFLTRQCVEKYCRYYGSFRFGERADLVFAAVEIYTGFSADRCVDRRQERRRNVDESDSALECRGREAAHIRNHASADVDHQRLSRIAAFVESLPD